MRGIKKINLMLLLASSLVANQCFAWGLAGGYVHSEVKAKDYSGLEFNLDGVGGSIEFSDFDSNLLPYLYGQYSTGEGTPRNGSIDVNYFEGNAGVGYLMYGNESLSLRLNLGLGLGVADLDFKSPQGNLGNTTTFFVIPVGLEAGYAIPNINLSLFGNVGYRYYMDVSDSHTTCADGYTEPQNGYDVCTNHGGVSKTSDYAAGNLSGLQFGAGIKIHF
jgi:hypothetical protein